MKTNLPLSLFALALASTPAAAQTPVANAVAQLQAMLNKPAYEGKTLASVDCAVEVISKKDSIEILIRINGHEQPSGVFRLSETNELYDFSLNQDQNQKTIQAWATDATGKQRLQYVTILKNSDYLRIGASGISGSVVDCFHY